MLDFSKGKKLVWLIEWKLVMNSFWPITDLSFQIRTFGSLHELIHRHPHFPALSYLLFLPLLCFLSFSLTHNHDLDLRVLDSVLTQDPTLTVSRPDPDIRPGSARDVIRNPYISHTQPVEYVQGIIQYSNCVEIFVYFMAASNLLIRLPTYPQQGSSHL